MVESISRKATGRSNFVSVGVVLFLGLFCAVGIAVSTFISFLPIYRAIQSRSWPAASCEVLSSRLVRSDDTARPDIQYRYHVDDRPYTGTLYNFVPLSDNFSDYQAVVDRYPPGRRFECYVNPVDPAQAVIDRELTFAYFFGLIFFVFFTVIPGGFIAVWFVAASHVRRKTATAAGAATASASRVRAVEMGQSGRIELKARTSPLGKLIGAILICLFWNAIVGLVTYFEITAVVNGEGWGWAPATFLLTFQIIGLALIVNVLYQMLALANPQPTITLSGESVRVGGSVTLEWQLSGAAHRVRSLTLTLEGREEAVSRRGKDRGTDTNVFHRSTLRQVSDSTGVARGATAVRIPDDTMHTFTADHNKIIWTIKMKGHIDRWPDIDEAFDITVTPVPSELGQFRGASQGAMTGPHLDLTDGRCEFKPGESVTGEVSWNVDRAASAEVRLFWYTRGKGTEDVGLVDTVAFAHPQTSDRRTFRFDLPEEPYSFSGKLISIIWAIELIVEPGTTVERHKIFISPTGREVVVTEASA